MADRTGADITLPLTPAKIGRNISAIVERAFPYPRQEECIKVGEMERELTAYVGEVVQAVYDAAAGIHRDAREQLARRLYIDDWAAGDPALHAKTARRWDQGEVSSGKRSEYLDRADQLIAVITGTETDPTGPECTTCNGSGETRNGWECSSCGGSGTTSYCGG